MDKDLPYNVQLMICHNARAHYFALVTDRIPLRRQLLLGAAIDDLIETLGDFLVFRVRFSKKCYLDSGSVESLNLLRTMYSSGLTITMEAL